MNVRISGNGNICAGEYDNIHISGSSTLKGPIRCNSFYCSGSSRCNGTLEVFENVNT